MTFVHCVYLEKNQFLEKVLLVLYHLGLKKKKPHMHKCVYNAREKELKWCTPNS